MDESYTPAPIWRRVIASTIDISILAVISMLFIVFEMVIFSTPEQSISQKNIDRLLGLPVIFLVSGYYLYFWGNVSMTPGEKLLNISVRSIEGGPLKPNEAFYRLFCLLIYGVATLGIGFFWCLFNQKRQTLYDKMSKTIVIKS